MRGCLGQTHGRRSSGSSESARVGSYLTARRQSKGMCLRVVQSIVTCRVCLWSRRQPKGIYPRAAQSVGTCHCAGGIRRGIRRSQQTEARERHTLSLAMWPRSTVLVGLGVMTPWPRGSVGNYGQSVCCTLAQAYSPRQGTCVRSGHCKSAHLPSISSCACVTQ